MADRDRIQKRLSVAKDKLRKHEGWLKDLERRITSLKTAIGKLEPHVTRAVEETKRLARGVRAGISAGASEYRRAGRK
jgi:hypothetical protein